MPKYIHIKINGNNTQSKKKTIAATQHRFNQEIKFLYHKKQKLNEQLYRIYLECANNWNGVWQYIQTTNSELDKVMDTLYQKLNKKLDALQGHKPVNHNKETMKHKFHTQIVNFSAYKTQSGTSKHLKHRM